MALILSEALRFQLDFCKMDIGIEEQGFSFLLSPAKAKSLCDMSNRCQPCGANREIAADDATVALPLLDAIK
jgi:hypothetical protein